jgi:hypothetical protein
MTSATLEQSSVADELVEEEVGRAHIDGESHSFVWIHDGEFAMSVLVDRPSQGEDAVRVLARLGPAEGAPQIKAVLADYRAHYLACATAERARPRPLEPGDLVPPEPFSEEARYA